MEAAVDLDMLSYLICSVRGDGEGWNAAQGQHERWPGSLEMTFNE